MSLLTRRRVLVVAALLAVPACASPPRCPPSSPAPAPSATVVAAGPPSAQPVKQLYRFDFTLGLTDPGKAPVVTEHTLNLQEAMPGELRTGKNVPLTTVPMPPPPGSAAPAATGRPGRPTPPVTAPLPGFGGPPAEASVAPRFAPRQDVGFLLRAVFQPNGEAMLLRADAEMSHVEDGGAIVKLVVRGEAPVVVGKPVLVASSEDPVTHRKLSLSVTATPLR